MDAFKETLAMQHGPGKALYVELLQDCQCSKERAFGSLALPVYSQSEPLLCAGR